MQGGEGGEGDGKGGECKANIIIPASGNETRYRLCSRSSFNTMHLLEEISETEEEKLVENIRGVAEGTYFNSLGKYATSNHLRWDTRNPLGNLLLPRPARIE